MQKLAGDNQSVALPIMIDCFLHFTSWAFGNSVTPEATRKSDAVFLDLSSYAILKGIEGGNAENLVEKDHCRLPLMQIGHVKKVKGFKS